MLQIFAVIVFISEQLVDTVGITPKVQQEIFTGVVIPMGSLEHRTTSLQI